MSDVLLMMAPEDILVEDRYRVDLGDVSVLAESIRTVGLLQRIVVTPEGRLVAGVRRLEALKILGWREIPVQVAHSLGSVAELLQAERDENVCRKDFAPSEIAALGHKLEQFYKPKVKAAQGARTDLTFGSREPKVADESSRTRAQVGQALGVSGPTYQRIHDVARDAEDAVLPAEQRQAAAEALERMDQGAGIRTTHDEYRQQVAAVVEDSIPAPIETKRQRDLAEAAKRRTEVLVGQCQAFAHGLPDLRVEIAAQVATTEEVEGWQQALTDGIRALTAFRKRLEGSSR